MAEEEKKEGEEAPAPPPQPKGPLLLAIVNSAAILMALGTLVFTRFVYQRPAITEEGERERLARAVETLDESEIPGFIYFEPATVHIGTTPAKPKVAPGTHSQIQGKVHYATVGFAIQIKDEEETGRFEAIRAVFSDKLLTLLGKKKFKELTTVQGRYLLRLEMVELVNELVKDSLATEVYFTHFVVQ